MTRYRCRVAMFFLFLALAGGPSPTAEAKSYVAYISESPAASSVYWVTKDAGFFKKHGLDVDLIFIDGSTRGIQTLISGGVPFTSAVGRQRQTGGRGHRHHQQFDQHLALLRLRQTRDQVSGRSQRETCGHAYPRHGGGLRVAAGP